MVYIACSLCSSSCPCYFTHSSSYLCHNPQCIAHTQTRPHDTVSLHDNGPLRRDPIIVRFIDAIAPTTNRSKEYDKYRVFEVPLLCVCGAGADCTMVTRLRYVDEEKEVIEVRLEMRGEERTINVVAKKVHTL